MINDDTRSTVKQIFTEYLEKGDTERHLNDMLFWTKYTPGAVILTLNRCIYS